MYKCSCCHWEFDEIYLVFCEKTEIIYCNNCGGRCTYCQSVCTRLSSYTDQDGDFYCYTCTSLCCVCGERFGKWDIWETEEGNLCTIHFFQEPKIEGVEPSFLQTNGKSIRKNIQYG